MKYFLFLILLISCGKDPIENSLSSCGSNKDCLSLCNNSKIELTHKYGINCSYDGSTLNELITMDIRNRLRNENCSTVMQDAIDLFKSKCINSSIDEVNSIFSSFTFCFLEPKSGEFTGNFTYSCAAKSGFQ